MSTSFQIFIKTLKLKTNVVLSGTQLILTLRVKILMIYCFLSVIIFSFLKVIKLVVGINGRVPDVDYFVMFNKLLLTLASNNFHYKTSLSLENKLQNTMQFASKNNEK